MEIMSTEEEIDFKLDSVMIIMSILTFLLLLFVLYLVRNVIKLVGLSDVPMLLQVIALSLSLSCKHLLLWVQGSCHEASRVLFP